MLEMSVSGQFLYFSLVSVFSGNAVTGASGSISGRKCIDGASMALLSGNVVEDAGGMYHANLYDWDTSGKNIGYLFSSSGCALVSFMAVTTGGTSGYLYPASGINVNATATVSSGSLYLASGSLFKNTFASGVLGTSGGLPTAWGNSGATTVGQDLDKSGITVGALVSGILSGQLVTLVSGQSYTASGIWPASGANVNATATVTSGQVWLASGQATSLNSGQSVLVYSGQLSGQPIAGLSGFIYPASGINVNATATVTSGQVWLASGQATSLNSGQSVLVYSGQLSGQPTTPLSGFVFLASGTTFQATITSGQVWIASGTQTLIYSGTMSGQFTNPVSGQVWVASGSITATANSGLFVTVPIATISGTTVVTISGAVYPASGVTSVVSAASLSGIVPASGSFVNVPIATISGVNATASINSGSLYLASGSILKTTLASGVLAVEIPYGMLKADQSGVTGEAIHSQINANRKLTNKWDTTTNSGFLTVFKEDATTAAYTQALTSQSGAQPVIALGDA